MKLLSMITEAYTIRTYLMSISVNLFHDSFESFFQAHPALVCSLMSSGLLVLNLLVMTIFSLILSKALVIGNPRLFLSLNHERTLKLIVLSIILLEIGDIVFSLVKCGNLCSNTTTMVFVMKKYDLQIDHNLERCHKIPIFAIFLVLGSVLEISIQIMCFLQNRKLNKYVNVYTVQPCLKTNLTKQNKQNSVAPQNCRERRKPRRRLETNDQQVPIVCNRELEPEETSLHDLAKEETDISRGILLRPGKSVPISTVRKHESLISVEDVPRQEVISTNPFPETDEYSFIEQNGPYLQQNPNAFKAVKTELPRSTMILIRPSEEDRKAIQRTPDIKERRKQRGNKHSSLSRNNGYFTTIPQYVLKSGHFTYSVLILFFFMGIENFVHQKFTEFSFSGIDKFNRVIAYYLAIYWCTFNKNIWKYTVRKLRAIISNIFPVFSL